MTTSRRKEASGQGWQEHFVDKERASATLSVGLAVSQSFSYITIPNFATEDERWTLLRSAMEVKEFKKDEDAVPGTHVLGATEAAHHNCTRFSVEALLDTEAKETSAVFVHRLLGFLEGNGSWGGHEKMEEMSDLAQLAFGTHSNLQSMNVTWYEEPDENGQMIPEPKVNIYDNGGYFKVHADGMNLTLLVVLSDEFEGGGTAFYRECDEDDEEKKEWEVVDAELEKSRSLAHVPDSVSKPPAGTAIIWCATLQHMALPVTKGTRAVYVGSFDLT